MMSVVGCEVNQYSGGYLGDLRLDQHGICHWGGGGGGAQNTIHSTPSSRSGASLWLVLTSVWYDILIEVYMTPLVTVMLSQG